MTSHPNPAAQVFAEGGDLLDMLKASRELTHACAVHGAWVKAAKCHETILGRADLTTCRACVHGQALAQTCPGGVRLALPSMAPTPDLGKRPATPEPTPAGRLRGTSQPTATAPGPGPMTTETSAVGGPGANGARECEKSPRIRPERLGLVRVSPRAKKCSQGASPLEIEAYAPRNTRAKLDPAEKRRRKAERMRRYRAQASAERKAEREEKERQEAKRKASDKAKKEREALAREQGRRIRILADTLAYLIPRHGEKGTLGLSFTRLIMADRTGLDMALPEFKDLCDAAGLTITGRGSLVIQLDDLALALSGLEKEAA